MKVLTIAGNTFRELIRGRASFAVLLYLLLLPALAIPGGYVAVGQERKILVDVGLSLLTLIGIFLGVAWGTGLAGGGIDRHSLGFMLSKPLDRWQLILGRFAGLVAAQSVATSLMGILLTLSHFVLLLLPLDESSGGGVSNVAGRDGWLFRLWLQDSSYDYKNGSMSDWPKQSGGRARGRASAWIGIGPASRDESGAG